MRLLSTPAEVTIDLEGETERVTTSAPDTEIV
jgi:hypothetical protein